MYRTFVTITYMGSNSRLYIQQKAQSIFARGGYEALSMRELAKESGVGLSSIYHFFTDKDVLLKQLFEAINRNLGSERAQLPKRRTAYDMLRDRIRFQFEHIEEVTFVLKYYLHYRPEFLRIDTGYLPAKGYLHIDEVIQKGISTGEYPSADPINDAKVMAHAINGFLLEYYPDPPKGRELTELTESISKFLHRAMTNERREYEVRQNKN